jgi:tetratricopeptide (TPR) repeat protein
MNPRSPEAIAKSRQAVEANPDDICARGDLITHLPSDDRYEHLLWMLNHHPEWDGFYLPYDTFASPFSGSRWGRYDELRQSWLRALDRTPRSAIVLYNAGMFFAIQEPERATTLLKEALQIDPDEPRFRSGLGMVYGLAQADPEQVQRRMGLDRIAPQIEFARYAQDQLQSSHDIELLQGAQLPFTNWDARQLAPTGYTPPPFMKELEARTALLAKQRNPGELQKSRYTQSACESPFLPGRHATP